MLLTEQWLQLFLNFALTWILSLSIFSDLAAYCLTVEIRLINVTGNWKNRNMLFNQDVLDENMCNEMWFFMSLYCSVSTMNLFGGKEMRDVGIWFPTSCLFVWCIIYLNGKIVNLRHVAYFFLSLTCFLLSLYQLPFTELYFERMLSFCKLGLKFGFSLNLGKPHYTEYLSEESGFLF